MPRTAYATICDDIRREINNKYSLMGIWAPVHYLPHFPITIMNFAIEVVVKTEVNDCPDRMSFTLIGPGESMIELETDMAMAGPPPDLPDGHPFRTIILHAMISNLSISQPGRMNVYVDVGEEKLLAKSIIFAVREEKKEIPSASRSGK